MPTIDPVSTRLTDEELLAEVPRLAACERLATADLIARLAELDARTLYAAEGCSSLFAYCTKRLHLLEDAAWSRVEAARAVQRFPVILERMRDGALTLTAVRLLARYLTDANCDQLLAWAVGRTKREIEEQIAAIAPRPDVASSLRKLPAPRAAVATASVDEDRTAARLLESPGCESPGGPAGLPAGGVSRAGEARADDWPTLALGVGDAASGAGPSPLARDLTGSPVPEPGPRPAEIRPLAPGRYSLRITLSADTHATLQRARALLRHQIPNGDPAAVIDRALTQLVEHLERTKFAARTPRPPAKETMGRRARRRPADPGEATRAEATPPEERPGSAPGDSPAARAEGSPIQPHGRLVHSTQAREACPPSAPGPTAPVSSRRSRYIPAAVKRAVWERDQGRCAFVGRGGRCSETGFLEFHHRVPYAEGGQATVGNLMLTCVMHNGHEARRWFGADVQADRAHHDVCRRDREEDRPPRDG